MDSPNTAYSAPLMPSSASAEAASASRAALASELISVSALLRWALIGAARAGIRDHLWRSTPRLLTALRALQNAARALRGAEAPGRVRDLLCEIRGALASGHVQHPAEHGIHVLAVERHLTNSVLGRSATLARLVHS